MVSQALSLINKKHEIKKLKDEVSKLNEQLEKSNQKSKDFQETINALERQKVNDKLKTNIFLETFQVAFEKEHTKIKERNECLHDLGRKIEDLRLQFIFLSNDADLATRDVRNGKLSGEYVNTFEERLQNISKNHFRSDIPILNVLLLIFRIII